MACGVSDCFESNLVLSRDLVPIGTLILVHWKMFEQDWLPRPSVDSDAPNEILPNEVNLLGEIAGRLGPLARSPMVTEPGRVVVFPPTGSNLHVQSIFPVGR